MSSLINASTSSGLVQTADTSGTLELQSNGTTQLTVSSTGAYGQLKSGTAQASTSGTSIDFTSIPSWVKRITVMLSGVSTNGTSYFQIQIGSGTPATTGYVSTVVYSGTAQQGYTATTGFLVVAGNGATDAYGGMITLATLGSNIWVSQGSLSRGDAYNWASSGRVSIGGTLDRVRITTVNGTDAFDAGSVNIMYEG